MTAALLLNSPPSPKICDKLRGTSNDKKPEEQAPGAGAMLSRILILLVAAWAAGTPGWAHHSHTNYEMTEYLNVQGTVTEIFWINPHIWIYVEMTGDDGESAIWALETATPAQLAINGVTRDTVHVGDVITARCHQLKDGSNGCLLGYLTGRDGIERLWD